MGDRNSGSLHLQVLKISSVCVYVCLSSPCPLVVSATGSSGKVTSPCSVQLDFDGARARACHCEQADSLMAGICLTCFCQFGVH